MYMTDTPCTFAIWHGAALPEHFTTSLKLHFSQRRLCITAIARVHLQVLYRCRRHAISISRSRKFLATGPPINFRTDYNPIDEWIMGHIPSSYVSIACVQLCRVAIRPAHTIRILAALGGKRTILFGPGFSSSQFNQRIMCGSFIERYMVSYIQRYIAHFWFVLSIFLFSLLFACVA